MEIKNPQPEAMASPYVTQTQLERAFPAPPVLRFLIETSVESAQGNQLWTVDAVSPEAALAKFNIDGGEFYDEEVEVTDTGKPRILRTIPITESETQELESQNMQVDALRAENERLKQEATKYRNEYCTSHAALEIVKVQRDSLQACVDAMGKREPVAIRYKLQGDMNWQYTENRNQPTPPCQIQELFTGVNAQAEFNRAINFAITQGSSADDFLRAWREGDTSDWPDFASFQTEATT